MKRYCISFGIMLITIATLVVLSACVGSVKIGANEVIDAIINSCFGNKAANALSGTARIIIDIRMPRIIAAILLGGGLAVSGFLLQVFFQNPIVGPYVLGISSGAKLCVAIMMIVFLDKGLAITSIGMIVAAFAGSMCAMGFVLAISFKVKKMSMLVVCGIMIGYICSAITDFFVTFANDSNIVNLHNWSLGSLSGMSWDSIFVMTVMIIVTVVAAFALSKPIGAYQMGEVYAKNMGVNVTLLRVGLILISSLLSACVTAFAGPISFVGIAVPHLVKMIMKSAKPIVLIPGCFMAGAIITLVCDDVARTMFAPTEVSISSVTAVLLVPVVLVMMVKRQRQ